MSAHTPSPAPPPPPPLLLTKRVTAFLSANLTPTLHTAALTTPSGKLLAHASAQPARVLRRQCAVAASLWAIHGGGSASGSGHSTPAGGLSPNAAHERRRNGGVSRGGGGGGTEGSLVSGAGGTWRGKRPVSAAGSVGGDGVRPVTVQLDSGVVFVMRRLRCGMLFVCVGDAGGGERQAHHGEGGGAAAIPGTAGQGAQAQEGSTTPPAQTSQGLLGSPSEAGSVLSGGTTGPGSQSGAAGNGGAGAGVAGSITSSTSTSTLSTAGVVALRRQVEELARWLDEKLGPLAVPDDGAGTPAATWDLIAA